MMSCCVMSDAIYWHVQGLAQDLDNSSGFSEYPLRYGDFPKWCYPQIIQNGATMFVLKPMVLGIILRKPPCMYVCMYVCMYIYITKIGLDQIKSKSVCFFVVNAFFICTYCCYSIIISKIILEQVTLFPWPILDTRQTYPFPAGLAIIHHYSQEWSWNILQHV